MNLLSIAMFLMTNMPKLIDAVRQIMASDAGKTIEQAGEDFLHHIRPGGPNAPALAHDATPLIAPTVVTDPRQASTTGD